MSGPKCNLPEESRAAALGLFDGQLSADEEDELRDMFPQYLFFHNEEADDGWNVSDGPVRVCFCTACRTSFEAVRGNYARGKLHGEPCNCPQCGRQVEGKAVYKFRYDMHSLERWIKVCVARAAPDGVLLIEAGDAVRRFNWDCLAGEVEWYPVKRYYIKVPSQPLRGSSPGGGAEVGGAVQMWCNENTEWGCRCPARREWKAKNSIMEPFLPNTMGGAAYYGEYCVLGLTDAIERAGFRYCQIFDFFYYEYAADIGQTAGGKGAARWIVRYLAWYALHPTIEMAVRCNLQGAVAELIQDGKKNARLIDWTGRTPAVLMRMDKQDARFFLKNGLDFGDLRDWREVSGKTTLTRYFEMVDQAGGKDNARELIAAARAAKVSFGRALHYVQSFRTRCTRNQPTMQTVIQVWKDYLAMAGQLGYDLRDETVRMPKDLTDRHDAAAALIRHQASEKEQKRYRKRRAALEKQFAFEMDGYVILVPTCAQEIVDEGKTLHHCVGGYAARHVSGSTTILFLRRARKQARSYLTIELYEKRGVWKLRQIHGYQNESYKHAPKLSARERFAWLLEPWLNWVNDGSPRDKDGKPIVKGNEEVKTA